MSDRGMWVMNDTKRCSGYKGHWECADQHPDHIVPFSEFAVDTYSTDGLQNKCRLCQSYSNHIQFTTQRPRHPITSEAKQNWKSRKAIELGGVPNTTQWQSFLDRAEVQWYEDIKAHLLNTAPAKKVLEFMSEFGQSKPMTKRIISKIEGEKVPEGWVYIVMNPDVPDILKIGKTFPDGIASIMSDARRFGRAELVAKYKFKEAYKAEQSIHKRLAKYNLRVLGYTDCGKELFKCDEIVAISAILSEGPVLDGSYNNLTLPHSTQAGLTTLLPEGAA